MSLSVADAETFEEDAAREARSRRPASRGPSPTATAGPRRFGLRLRDHGVGPLFVLTVTALTLGAQLGLIAYILLILHVTDGVMEERNFDTLAGFIVLYLFFVGCSAVFLHLRTKVVAGAAERFGLRLQSVAMQAAVRNAVRTETGSGLAVLEDISIVRRFIANKAATNLLDLIGAMVALYLLFYLDAGLGWIGVGGIVMVTILGVIAHLATRGLAHRARRQLRETSMELRGQLVHPDLVRGMGLLTATMFRWQGRYDTALRSLEQTQRRADSVNGIEELFTEIYYLAIKVYASFLIFAHIGSIGMLIAAWHFCAMVIRPFSNITQSWDRWSLALSAWRRLKIVLGEDGEPAVHPPVPDTPAGLSIEAASFWPEGRPRAILSGITLRLDPGTVITVEGPNGVGKSTLVRLVLGLMPPTAGRVLLDGQDTWFSDRATLGARIGYLPQDVQLLDGTVYDNIGRGPDAPAELVVEASRTAGAHDMIGRLAMGYQTQAGVTAGLSAGQRRLIGLARALYGQPRILVMDEPEVGLDGAARAAMRGAVQAMRNRDGITMIVTHEPHTWAPVTDLRLILGPGGLWQVRPADDTMAAPREVPALVAGGREAASAAGGA